MKKKEGIVSVCLDVLLFTSCYTLTIIIINIITPTPLNNTHTHNTTQQQRAREKGNKKARAGEEGEEEGEEEEGEEHGSAWGLSIDPTAAAKGKKGEKGEAAAAAEEEGEEGEREGMYVVCCCRLCEVRRSMCELIYISNIDNNPFPPTHTYKPTPTPNTTQIKQHPTERLAASDELEWVTTLRAAHKIRACAFFPSSASASSSGAER